MAKLRIRSLFPTISLEEKDELAENHEEITIHTINAVPTGKYGKAWWAVVFTSVSFPEKHTLGFAANAFRDSAMSSYIEQLFDADEPLTCYVGKFPTDKGNPAYGLIGDDEEETEELPY
jgi:hypothetical protein